MTCMVVFGDMYGSFDDVLTCTVVFGDMYGVFADMYGRFL